MVLVDGVVIALLLLKTFVGERIVRLFGFFFFFLNINIMRFLPFSLFVLMIFKLILLDFFIRKENLFIN